MDTHWISSAYPPILGGYTKHIHLYWVDILWILSGYTWNNHHQLLNMHGICNGCILVVLDIQYIST